MKRLVVIAFALLLGACTPLAVQQPGQPPAGFAGPRLQPGAVVSFDGTRLPLTRWEAEGEPWAVIVALHGMNDYSNAFHLAAPYWAEQGVTTYAYDQRGFGRAPGRGVWAGDELMMEDLRTVAALVRQEHPNALVAVVGESMGGAVAASAFATQRPPAAHRLVLMAPAVWGWEAQPLPYRTMLWFAAHLTGDRVYTPPRWLARRIQASDNRKELLAMGRDPLMIWGARSDALYGLVSLMDRAAKSIGSVRVPILFLYGANDQIIPEDAAFAAAAHLKPEDRSAYYSDGWHLLMRDLQGPVVWADVLAFIRDPDAPLPSGAPKVPGSPARGGATRVAAGL